MFELDGANDRWPSTRFLDVAVFCVAFAARLLVPLTSRGLVGNYSYDASVYYSAGAAVLRGRVPYRDFVLLHPPGAILTVAPAAWLGRLTTDRTGFALASLEFTALGALSAVLVAVVARGLGAGRGAALGGALFYAVWFPSIRAEYLSRLEPLGNVLVLCGLVGYVGIGGRHGRRSAVLCGAALGAAASVKIWYAAPLAVVLGFLVARRRFGDAGRAALGSTAAAVLICGPWFALAPASMWRMVVAEQLGRTPSNGLRAMITLQRLPSSLSRSDVLLLDALLFAAVSVLLLSAWHSPSVRLPAALLLTGGAVVVAAPSWFVSYADFLTPAAALCVATGAATAWARRGPLVTVAYTVGGIVAVIGLVVPANAMWYGHGSASTSLPPRRLASAIAPARCVMSDSPMALIGLDALDRNLGHRCRDWIDVTGRTYAPDMAVRGPDGQRLPRVANPRWQAAVRDYLLSGDAVIVIRTQDAGIAPATLDAIRGGGVLAANGSFVVYKVPDRTAP